MHSENARIYLQPVRVQEMHFLTENDTCSKESVHLCNSIVVFIWRLTIR